MSGELHAFLADDHERLVALLEELRRGEGGIPHDRYDEFRRGLLRHTDTPLLRTTLERLLRDRT